MIRAHVIKLYPTREQEVLLNKTAGACRFAWNQALSYWDKQYKLHCENPEVKKPTTFAVAKWYMDNREEWSKEVAFVCQRQSILRLGTAFINYFKRPDAFKHPKFHKKGYDDSFDVNNDKLRFIHNRVSIPKVGRVKIAEELRYSGKICGYVVKKEAGNWFLVATVDTNTDVKPQCVAPDSIVGIDVGLQHPAVASDGTVLRLPTEKLDKLEAKLKRYQKALSRSYRNTKGHSRRYQKTLIKKQKTQQKINNIRKDAVHKFTTTVSKNHGTVVIEDLDIKEMRDKAPARSVRRAYNKSLMNLIHFQLSYKCQRLVKANRYYPSSKLCSSCGHKKEDLKITDRTYVCPECGLSIDRDLNAALNLMHYEDSIRPGADSPVVLTEGMLAVFVEVRSTAVCNAQQCSCQTENVSDSEGQTDK